MKLDISQINEGVSYDRNGRGRKTMKDQTDLLKADEHPYLE